MNLFSRKEKAYYRLAILLVVILFNFNAISQDIDPPYFNADYSKKFTNNLFAATPEPGLILFVSLYGNDRNKGSRKKPFKTPEAARDAIRALKKSKGLPSGGVHVVLKDGTWNFRSNTFVLSSEDSGTKDAPIVYRAQNKGAVTFSAGVDIPSGGFTLVTDKELLARLNEKAIGKVMSIDLSGKNFDGIFIGDGKYGQLAVNDYMLQIAQWPNKGYHHIKEFIDEGPTRRWLKPGEKPMPYTKENPTGGKFRFAEELPQSIQTEFEYSGDIRARGFFHNDWYYQDEAVGKINDGVIQLLHHTRYGIVDHIKSMPRRICLINVLSELDQPGEWYYDRIEKRLYMWPIKGFIPGESTVTAIQNSGVSINKSYEPVRKRVPNTKHPLISLNETSYITIRDLNLEHTGDLGIYINGGKYNLLAGCIFRNGTGQGVTINGGKYNGIASCDFYNLYTAFGIKGGNLKTLESCNNFAYNNIVRNCHIRGYGVVTFSGVGLYCANNLFHSMNGAMMYETVNFLMEYNEFYNIGYEMGDFNVAYIGAQWYTMNNVVRYNFVHHLIEPGGHPVSPFRNDDGGAGLKLYGNVFYRPGRCGAQYSGPLNSFQNNITMICNHMWWTNKRAVDSVDIQRKWAELSQFGRDLPKGDKGDYLYITEQIIGERGWEKSPWIDTFPELKKVIETNPWAQTFGYVNRNYTHNVRQAFHIHGGDGTVEGMESKKTGRFRDLPREGEFKLPEEITLDAFVDVESLDFNFKEGFTPKKGFTPIPFDKIGLIKDMYRTNPLDKHEYRSQVYGKFKDEKSGRYNAEKVNARYPVPDYLKEY